MLKSDVAQFPLNAIGQSILRKEDPTLLTGRGRYLADIALPGMLHATFVRSPFAHAKITHLDVSAAAALPGVELVWTGADTQQYTQGISAGQNCADYVHTIQPAMAHEVVHFVGESVAIVIATSRRLAEDAAELIDVDYEELPVVAGIEQANEASAIANAAIPDNVIHHNVRVAHDVDDTFANAALVVEDVFYNNRVSASPMETRGCIVRHEWTTGLITFWSATQIPGFLRTMLATFLQIPEHTIEVITPQVGGGFGQKAHVHVEELVICLCARELSQPVSWVEDRQENLLSATHAKHQINTMAIAVDADGRFLALKNHATTDSGAYNCFPWSASIEAKIGVGTVTGVYKIPLVRAESLEVATNKCLIGAYRGVGWSAGQIAREILIDRVARALDLSPFEIRRRNVIRTEDFPYTNATDLRIHEGTFLETIDVLERMVDYASFRKRQLDARANGKYIGLGLSIFHELGGIGTRTNSYFGNPVTTYDSSTVRVDPTGTVTVTTGLASSGQGLPTTLAQIAADALGVSVDKVVIRAESTANAYGLGTFASRAAVFGAGSIGRAADVLRTKIKQIAGHMLEVSPEDIVLENNTVHVAGVPARGMSMAEVAGAIYFAESAHPENFDPTLEATATFDPADNILANGGHAAIVEVDIETGIVRIEKVFAVEDCGQMINPMIVEGQMRGGIAQAIGSTMLEELIYDENGQLVTTTFMDYLLPSAVDVPDIEIEHLTTPSDLVPGGIKGLGESAMISAPAAIAGAVNDALACLGVTLTRGAITPNRIFEALQNAQR